MTGKKTIKDICLSLLSKRDYLSSELKRKLFAHGFSKDDIDEAIIHLKELGYINDKRYIKNFLISHLINKGWGPKKVENELLRRGAEKDDIEEIFFEVFSEDKKRYDEKLLDIIRKKIERSRLNLNFRKDREKLFRYLFSKGFTKREIMEKIEEINGS